MTAETPFPERALKSVTARLLNKWCDCEPFPSGVLLILVSGLLQVVLGFSLRILLSSLAV